MKLLKISILKKITRGIKNNTSNNLTGYTLLEIAMALFLFALICSLTAPWVAGACQNYWFYSQKDQLLSILWRARSLALTETAGQSWSVKFLSDKYVLFYGEYDPALQSNIVFPINFSFRGAEQINFQPGQGMAEAQNLTLYDNYNHQSFIIVNEEGQISWSN